MVLLPLPHLAVTPLRRLAVTVLAALAVVGATAGAATATAPPPAAEQPDAAARWPVHRLTAAAPYLPPATGDRPWRAVVELTVDGRQRSFSVLVPPGLPRPAPVVLGLHGLHQSRAGTEAMMRLLREAAPRGFVAVYPSGSDASWNAGRCCGRAAAGGVDDVEVLRRVVATVSGAHPVDPRRVYAVGYSNGGMMAYKLACEAPDLLAAIAVVAGAYVTAESCRPTTATPTLVVHGRRDTVVPWAGLRVSPLRTRLPSVAQSVAVMSRRNAPAGVPTRLVSLPRQGHGWPTTASPDRYDASTHVLDFLLAHARP